MTAELPPGRLVAWYGDDFTGSAAVLEALAFGGIDAVLFLDLPTPAQLARFAHCRAVGIAGIARSQSPAWMNARLPGIYAALAGLKAQLAHYKICSTLDSSPTIGSIGRAIELAEPVWQGRWYPLLVAAPTMGRYQAFSQLFATAGEVVYRIDRHPVMSRHPVTPMDEADVRRHVARQTSLAIGSLELPQLRGDADTALDAALAGDTRIVALDSADDTDLAIAGRLIWERRETAPLAIGSQGVEYALLAFWRSIGAIDDAPPPGSAGKAAQIAVVSGSVSPTTAAQIAWAAANGFKLVPFDAVSVLDDAACDVAISYAVTEAVGALGAGRSVLIHSANGPDDPAVAAFRDALARSPVGDEAANARIGTALGRILDAVLSRSGISRAVISGGDTSGHAAQMLGIEALTALAPTIPGAALCRAHRADGTALELALKGGQMGTPDYFGWIRDGGGPRPSH